MSYRLGAGTSVSSEVKRVLNSEIGAALETIKASDAESRDSAVHEARKSIKKLRALLRLVSPNLPAEVYREENGKLRNIGRNLSELRDSQAILDAFDAVKGELHLPVALVRAARVALIENKKQTEMRVDPAVVFDQTRAALQEVSRTLVKLPLPASGFSLLEEGLERTYKRGRKAFRYAKRAANAAAFHDWRKRVKEHWYHVRLLAEVGSEDWARRLQHLKELEGVLGDDHNLAVLAERLTDARFRNMAGKLAEISQHLRARAVEVAKAVYGNRWSSVADELGDAHAVWPAKPGRRKPSVAPQPVKSHNAVA